jgi:DNA-binding transcriptional MerR regulator
MRSAELAELAGVTVRTLRHYHQIGLLDEPERSSNGYRTYTVRHLAAVLRIGAFAELGIPLAEVGRVLDDTAETARLLDRIDDEAAAEIERLAARRAAIADLRRGGASPDLPASLVRFAAYLSNRPERSRHDEVVEREQLALVRHFSDDASMPWLVTALEHMSASGEQSVALFDRFARLDADATDDEIDELAASLAALVRAAVGAEQVPTLSARHTSLLLEHQLDSSTPAQRRVLLLLFDALDSPQPD